MAMFVDVVSNHHEFTQFVADYEPSKTNKAVERNVGQLTFSHTPPSFYIEPSVGSAVNFLNTPTSGALPAHNRTVEISYGQRGSMYTPGWNKNSFRKGIELDAREIVHDANLQRFGVSVQQSKIFALFHEVGHAVQNAQEDFDNTMLDATTANGAVLNAVLSYYTLHGVDDDAQRLPEMVDLKRSVQEGYADVFAATLIAQSYPKDVAETILNAVILFRYEREKDTPHSYNTTASLEQYMNDGMPTFTNFAQRHAYVSQVVATTAVNTVNAKELSPTFAGLLLGARLHANNPQALPYENVLDGTAAGKALRAAYPTPEAALKELQDRYPMFAWSAQTVAKAYGADNEGFLSSVAISPLLDGRKQLRVLEEEAPEQTYTYGTVVQDLPARVEARRAKHSPTVSKTRATTP